MRRTICVQDVESLRQASRQFDLELKACPSVDSSARVVAEMLTSFSLPTFAACMQEQALAVSGHSWGNAKIEGGVLVLKVDARPAFRVPLRDVSQVVQSRDEVWLLTACARVRSVCQIAWTILANKSGTGGWLWGSIE